MDNRPIGVFDSGIGGLSVLARIIKLLPNENYIYYGDTLNLPYGNKSKEQLVEISSGIFDFFKSKNTKAVVMACNTTSATVYDVLKSKYDFKIYPILQNAAKFIAENNYKSIGVFATLATVNSHAYKKEIQKYNNNINVYENACPEWVNIVENSLWNEQKSIDNIKLLLSNMLKNNVDKIILGCTHYPYLLSVLSKFTSIDIFIDPSVQFAKYIAEDLSKNNLLNSGNVTPPEFYTSFNHEQFENASSLFYKVKNAKEIKLTDSKISCRFEKV